MKHIMIVDDDIHINQMLEEVLTSAGYKVTHAYSGTEALLLIPSIKPDLILLDLMLPGLSGEEIIEEISHIPVIVISAKIDTKNKISLLLNGAVDYVTKPFRPLEVVARVKAQLRRYKKYSPATNAGKIQPELSYSKLRLNTQTHECLLEGEAISLTPTEFSILHVLLANAGNVVSIEDLFHVVWKDEYYSKNSSTITVHIRHLREKLKDTSDNPQYIKTIWGVGYKI